MAVHCTTFFVERQVFEMAGLDYLIERNVIDALEEVNSGRS